MFVNSLQILTNFTLIFFFLPPLPHTWEGFNLIKYPWYLSHVDLIGGHDFPWGGNKLACKIFNGIGHKRYPCWFLVYFWDLLSFKTYPGPHILYYYKDPWNAICEVHQCYIIKKKSWHLNRIVLIGAIKSHKHLDSTSNILLPKNTPTFSLSHTQGENWLEQLVNILHGNRPGTENGAWNHYSNYRYYNIL